MIKKHTALGGFVLVLALFACQAQAQSAAFHVPIEERETEERETGSEIATSGLHHAPEVSPSNSLPADKGYRCAEKSEGAAQTGIAVAWFDEAHPQFWHADEQRRALIKNIESLRYDGLTPSDYLAILPVNEPSNECSEKHLTSALLAALSDLFFGKVDPVASGLLWRQTGLSADDRLSRLRSVVQASNGDVGRAFDMARPKSRRYTLLKKAYKDQLQRGSVSWPRVATGPTLRVGDQSSRVVQLRDRLSGDPATHSNSSASQPQIFDKGLSEIVRQFQSSRGIKADGIVGPDTLRELNRSYQNLLTTIRLNLERLRWVDDDLGQDGLLVDIAGQRLYLNVGDNLGWSGRIQVGTSARQTPALVSYLSHLTLNPTWTVPPTVLRKDKLPEIRKDPAYLSRHHIRVFDQLGSELDPSVIDWNRPGPVTLRQDAGPDSALGLVAFRFANPFSVYLHDTPSKKLFDVEERFFSSGCVRVENAPALAEQLVKDHAPGQISRYREIMDSGKTRNLSLSTQVPLLMAYWTVVADEQGNLRYRPDLYNRDARLEALLNSSG